MAIWAEAMGDQVFLLYVRIYSVNRQCRHVFMIVGSVMLHCTFYMSSRSNITLDCCAPAVSFLTVAWMTITPVSVFWGAFLPLHAAWSVYDRPLLSPVFITFIPMMLLKFPPGYPVRLF